VARRWVSALLALALIVAGCRHWPPRARAVRECPGELVSTDAIAGEFLLRQRVRIAAGERVQSLQLVAQKRGGELLLLGIDPFGVELFTLHQRGVQTRLEALPPPLLEVPPQNLLRDLHRIRFLGIPEAHGDGAVRARRGDTEIEEIWQAGRLRRRSFRGVGADPQSAVVLVFAAAEAGGAVEIRNPACGYVAEFATLAEQSLP